MKIQGKATLLAIGESRDGNYEEENNDYVALK
jgi:hypothetical protein